MAPRAGHRETQPDRAGRLDPVERVFGLILLFRSGRTLGLLLRWQVNKRLRIGLVAVHDRLVEVVEQRVETVVFPLLNRSYSCVWHRAQVIVRPSQIVLVVSTRSNVYLALYSSSDRAGRSVCCFVGK